MRACDEIVGKKSLMFTKVRYANKKLFAFVMWDSYNSMFQRISIFFLTISYIDSIK